MTTDEIKKGLEICSHPYSIHYTCGDCPYGDTTKCIKVLLSDARECIIKQEQEISFQVQGRARLQREIDELEQAHEQRVEEINQLKTECTLLDDELRNARQDTINVLNKLKEKAVSFEAYHLCNIIDKLIKEQLKCPK